MAYDKSKITNKLLENIENNEDLTTFEDAATSVAPALRTLYDWKLHEMQDIKDAIAQNKIKIKQRLRRQWKDETASPTLQLALYKLLATDQEKKALSMEYRSHSGRIAFDSLEIADEAISKNGQ